MYSYNGNNSPGKKRSKVEGPQVDIVIVGDDEASTSSGIKCYICGLLLSTNGFEIHYSNCKSAYMKSDLQKEKPLVEPELLREIVNKIVFGLETQAELDGYNQLADKLHFDLISKRCGKCKKAFLPDVYLKHIRTCMHQEKKISMAEVDFSKLKPEKSETQKKNEGEENRPKRRRKKSMDDIRSIKHYDDRY